MSLRAVAVKQIWYTFNKRQREAGKIFHRGSGPSPRARGKDRPYRIPHRKMQLSPPVLTL